MADLKLAIRTIRAIRAAAPPDPVRVGISAIGFFAIAGREAWHR